jgi:hypothetical protein
MEFEPNDPPHAWRYHAKCAKPEVYPQVVVADEVYFTAGKADTELFFPPRDRALYKPVADAAKAICYGRDGLGDCPVRKECLLESLARDEVHGIFGGKSHRERAAMVRRQQEKHPDMTIEEFVRSEHCK